MIGNVAGTTVRRPLVTTYSDGGGQAPLRLTRTVEAGVNRAGRHGPGTPDRPRSGSRGLSDDARRAGGAGARGFAAVLVQVSGERPPAATTRSTRAGCELFGRAVLRTIYALDTGRTSPRARRRRSSPREGAAGVGGAAAHGRAARSGAAGRRRRVGARAPPPRAGRPVGRMDPGLRDAVRRRGAVRDRPGDVRVDRGGARRARRRGRHRVRRTGEVRAHQRRPSVRARLAGPAGPRPVVARRLDPAGEDEQASAAAAAALAVVLAVVASQRGREPVRRRAARCCPSTLDAGLRARGPRIEACRPRPGWGRADTRSGRCRRDRP